MKTNTKERRLNISICAWQCSIYNNDTTTLFHHVTQFFLVSLPALVATLPFLADFAPIVGADVIGALLGADVIGELLMGAGVTGADVTGDMLGWELGVELGDAVGEDVGDAVGAHVVPHFNFEIKNKNTKICQNKW